MSSAMWLNRSNEESIQNWKGTEFGQVVKSNYLFTTFLQHFVLSGIFDWRKEREWGLYI